MIFFTNIAIMIKHIFIQFKCMLINKRRDLLIFIRQWCLSNFSIIVTLLFAATLLVSLSKQAMSQGLTVPTGSRIDLFAGDLYVAGTITIESDGTITTTSGSVGMTGDWLNSGDYTPSQGTLLFYGSGNQTVFFNGNGVTRRPYNLAQVGSGNLELYNVDPYVVVDGTITIANGTLDANNVDIFLKGDWDNEGSFTHTDGTVELNGANQTIYGSTYSFYDLVKKNAGGLSLNVESGRHQYVSGSLTLTGTGAGNLLSIGNTGGGAGTIFLLPDTLQNLNFLTVSNVNATGGLTLVARNSVNASGPGTNLNWVFGAATIIWEGDVNSDWNIPENWNLGVIPLATDNVVIADVSGSGVQPVLDQAETIYNLFLLADAALDVDEFGLTVSGSLDNNGTVILRGTDNQVQIVQDKDTDSGTFRYVGDVQGTGTGRVIEDYGGYFNLEINDTNRSDFFYPEANLVVNGDLSVTSGSMTTYGYDIDVSGAVFVDGGTLFATNSNLDIDGSLSISAGTLFAPDINSSFTLAGDFVHMPPGGFGHNAGTIILDGNNQQFLGTSDTVFYDFNKTLTVSSATLTFTTASEKIIAPLATLKLYGVDVNNRLNIVSDSSGIQGNLTLSPNGLQALKFLSVTDNDAGNGVMLYPGSSVSGGNNDNWTFTAAVLTWDGNWIVDQINWDNPGNWDVGFIPRTVDSVIIANTTNQPVLTDDAGVVDLTVNSNANIQLAGFDMIASGAFSNEGTIYARGSETIFFGTVDTDSGLVEYTGFDGAVGSKNTISGLTTYYNVVFNDNTGGTVDIFSMQSDMAVSGSLTLSSGTLNVSENAVSLDLTNEFIQNGGDLIAENTDMDVNGTITFSAGSFSAPTTGKSFTVAGDFNAVGIGNFSPNTGTVTFDTINDITISGNTTFYNFKSIIPGKSIYFQAGSETVIGNDFMVQGDISLDLSLFSATSGTPWKIEVSAAQQVVQFVGVKDSNVVNAFDILNVSGSDLGNNDFGEVGATPDWQFAELSITYPEEGKTVDETPTLIGTADAGATVTFYSLSDDVGIGEQAVGSVEADASGRFMWEIVDANKLDIGANYIRPEAGATIGLTINVIVAAAPSTDNQPNITSNIDTDRVDDESPTITGKGLASESVLIWAMDDDDDDPNAPADDLFLQEVGSGTIDASGNYSIDLHTSLVPGNNYLATIVDGVASDILYIVESHIYGVVFESDVDEELVGAVVYLLNEDGSEAAVAAGKLILLQLMQQGSIDF